MRVQEKEKEKERARDEERKIKAKRKRTRCGQWRKSLENKNMMRLERIGSMAMGIRVWRRKGKREKKKKKKGKESLEGKKVKIIKNFYINFIVKVLLKML